MTFRQIVKLTRQIATEESERALAAWLFYFNGSSKVDQARSKEPLPSNAMRRRLMKLSPLADEIINDLFNRLNTPTVAEMIEMLKSKKPAPGSVAEALLTKLLVLYDSAMDLRDELMKDGGTEPRFMQHVGFLLEKAVRKEPQGGAKPLGEKKRH